MCGRSRASFVSLVLPLALWTAACPASADDKARERYASPKAVFDAFRQARARRDVRSLFPLLTPEAQASYVAESLFSCLEIGTARNGGIVPKYVDVDTIHDDYEKQYKKKHGTDLAKAEAEHKKDPMSPLPPRDGQLWSDVVAAHVKDKVGFCEAVLKLDEKEPVWPLGELNELAVQGDTATGKAKVTVVQRPGESPPAVDKVDKKFLFRQIDGGWLLDSL